MPVLLSLGGRLWCCCDGEEAAEPGNFAWLGHASPLSLHCASQRACFVLSVCFEHLKHFLPPADARDGSCFDAPWASSASLGRTASGNIARQR